MKQRNDEGTERRSKLPWPMLGFLAGILGYLAIRYGIGWYASSQGGPSLAGLAHQASGGALDPYAWAVLGICWLGAIISWAGRRKLSRLPGPTIDAAGAPPDSTDASAQQQPVANEPEPANAKAPSCPRCGAPMYQRFNLQTQQMYWGCVKYPGCKGSLPL